MLMVVLKKIEPDLLFKFYSSKNRKTFQFSQADQSQSLVNKKFFQKKFSSCEKLTKTALFDTSRFFFFKGKILESQILHFFEI